MRPSRSGLRLALPLFMEMAEKVGEVIELIEETELYGREAELLGHVIQGDFAGAFQLCAHAVRQDYALISGVPLRFARLVERDLLRLGLLEEKLAKLSTLRSSKAA